VKADRVVVVLPSEGDDVARIGPDDLS
jgi:hypothetical protein